jgi:transcription antitermination factor NusG
VNYPWDAWQTNHPDISWYRKISRAYADTVHAHAREGYMTFLNNGITKGIDWYQVEGSRQDYVNFYLYGREVTIELSNNKIPAEEEIESYWNYNRNSLLQFITAAHSGFHGTITDSLSGDPLQARIRIIEHDRDNSFVFSNAEGNYFRPIDDGTYHVVFSAPGYRYKIIPVTVGTFDPADVNVMLSKDFDLKIFPNPFRNVIKLNFPYSGYMLYITFIDITGRKAKIIQYPVTHSGEHEISVKSLVPGYYIIDMRYNNQVWQFRAIKSND